MLTPHECSRTFTVVSISTHQFYTGVLSFCSDRCSGLFSHLVTSKVTG